MGRIDRLARLGLGVCVSVIAACGRTGVLSAPVPDARIDPCPARGIPSGRIGIAIADPTDSAATADARVTVALLVFDQVVVALHPRQCPDRSTGPLGGLRSDAGAALDVRHITEADARDALDVGVDILATRDAAVISYAATRGDLITIPLSWDRTYVLLVPGQTAVGGVPPPDSLGATLRSSLASDAVRAESRPFASATWWLAGGSCDSDSALMSHPESGSHTAPGTSPPAAPAAWAEATRIVYPQGDNVARALAERVAVLAATGSPSLAALAPGLDPRANEMRVVGVAADPFARALSAGTAGAYVVAIPSRAAPSCRDRRLLTDAVPWLTAGPDDRNGDIVPLIETRARAIVRRDAVARLGAAGDSASLAQSRGRYP